MRRVAVIAAVVALAGCSATTVAPTTPEAGAPPSGYRTAALASARQTFFDPYTVRDAQISSPLYASAVFDGDTPFPRKGWIVCVKANAKNRYGAYTGQQLTVMLFRGEVVDLTLSGPQFEGQLADHCKSAVFSPFDELEATS